MKQIVLYPIGFLLFLLAGIPGSVLAQDSGQVMYETTSEGRAQRAMQYLQQKSPDSQFQITEKRGELPPTVFVFGPFSSKAQAEALRSKILKSRRPTRIFEKGGQFWLMTPKLIGRSDLIKFQSIAKDLDLASSSHRVQLAAENVTLYRIVSLPPGEAKDVPAMDTTGDSTEDLSGGLIIIRSNSDSAASDLEFGSADQVSEGASLLKWRWNLHLSPLYFYEAQEMGGFALGRVSNEFALASRTHLKMKVNFQTVVLGEDSQSEFLIDDLFLRQSVSDFQFSLGWQKIIWGQVFENSAFDRISRHNMIQGFEGKLEDRRVSMPLARIEYTRPFFKVDLIAAPKFHGPVLPEPGVNPWSMVDTNMGIIPGVDQSPITTALAQEGSFQSEFDDDFFTRGARVTLSKAGYDLGATYLKTLWNQPTYYLNPKVLAQLALGVPLNTAIAQADDETFLLFYPETEIFGFDLRRDLGLFNLGLELAHITHYPATQESFLPMTLPVWMWVISTEWYPGDGNDQVNVQIVGVTGEFEDTIEESGPIYILGQWQTYFHRREWQGTLRTFYFLGETTGSLNINIAWLLHEPHRFALDSYYYWGAADTLGEAWQKTRSVGVSWSWSF